MLWSDVLHLSEATNQAWDALRREVRSYVARRVAPADVDDVVQEVLAALAKGEPHRAQRLGAYLQRIARNTVAEHHRKRAREHTRLARFALEPDDEDGEPVTVAEARLAAVMDAFVAQLSPSYAEALRAVDVEGRSQADVARALGIPLSSLRTRVQRARAELRAMVQRCCQIELDARGRVLSCEPRGSGCAC